MIETVTATDKELLEGLLRADPGQVQRLYDEYQPGILRYVERNGGLEADGRDIFQDALLILYRKMKTGDLVLTAALRTYLLAICRNLWRTRQRNRREYRLLPGEGEEYDDPEADTIEMITRMNRERIFRDHFEALGLKCREILSLFFARVKMQAIAQQLGLSEKYVKKRKFECKEALIEAIRKDPRYSELRF